VVGVSLGRLPVEEGHLQPLALGPAVLEPELHVLGLEPGELLPVRHPVQLLRVLQDELQGTGRGGGWSDLFGLGSRGRGGG
jgi:hypothetical protein